MSGRPGESPHRTVADQMDSLNRQLADSAPKREARKAQMGETPTAALDEATAAIADAAAADTPAEIAAAIEALGPDDRPAANVVEALLRVMRDMPAIGKDRRGPSDQGSYAFRGIEDITRRTAALFARHGVLMVPHVKRWEWEVFEKGGKRWTDDMVEVEYECFGPGGVNDRIVIGPVPGRGRDNSDKGSNKAMTGAWKYALTQALQIADQKDDNDANHDEVDADEPRSRGGNDDEVAATIAEMLEGLAPDDQRAVRATWKAMIADGKLPPRDTFDPRKMRTLGPIMIKARDEVLAKLRAAGAASTPEPEPEPAHPRYCRGPHCGHAETLHDEQGCHGVNVLDVVEQLDGPCPCKAFVAERLCRMPGCTELADAVDGWCELHEPM